MLFSFLVFANSRAAFDNNSSETSFSDNEFYTATEVYGKDNESYGFFDASGIYNIARFDKTIKHFANRKFGEQRKQTIVDNSIETDEETPVGTRIKYTFSKSNDEANWTTYSDEITENGNSRYIRVYICLNLFNRHIFFIHCK